MIIVSYGAVDTFANAVKYGDVNNDELINNRDAALVMQFINKWSVTIDVDNADVNIDNVINNRDYGLLMQYINKWDVRLGFAEDGLVNDGVNPEYYRGTTVKFAATLYPEVEGTANAIAAFEEKYDIDVEIIFCEYHNYTNEVCALIAAGDSPDVARSQGDFPLSLSYLQPLDAAKLDYSEEIWNQYMFDATTFGGSPYLCNTNGNVLFNTDIVIYNKSLLKLANAQTPEEYDKLGKWTWDAFFEIGRACQNITGGYGCGFYSRESALNMTGASSFKLDNGRFVNGIDSFTVDVFTKHAQAWQEGLIGWEANEILISGDAGIITTSTWRLKNDGYLQGLDYSDIGFYRLPDYDEYTPYYSTGCFVGWGLIDGAKNPVGAGLFLRYYLDCKNYDSSDIFISDEAAEFFFDITDIDYDYHNPYFTYCYFTEDLAGIDYFSDIYYAMSYDPYLIPSRYSYIKKYVDIGCDNFNAFIQQHT